MIGFTLYVSLLANSSRLILMIPFILILLRDKGNIPIKRELPFFAAFMVLVMINRIMHLTGSIPFEPGLTLLYYPYQLSFIVVMVLGKRITKLDFAIFLVCVIIEITFSFIDYTKIDFKPTSLLYVHRMTGFSGTSSLFAQKILLAFVAWIGLSRTLYAHHKILLYCSLSILGLGFFITFNRSAILAASTLWILWLFFSPKGSIDVNFARVLRTATVIIGVILIIFFTDDIARQFLRGKEAVSLEARGLIWESGLAHLRNHPFLGNGSFPFRIPYRLRLDAHLHNSLLQFMADNGIIIGSIFLIWIMGKLNRHNIPFVASLFVYNFFQYTMFWSFSVVDVFLYTAILSESLYDADDASDGRSPDLQRVRIAV